MNSSKNPNLKILNFFADIGSSIGYPINKIGLTNVHIDNADRRSYSPNLESKNEVAS